MRRLRGAGLGFLNRLLGKSLSLLCGSLTWLREHKAKEFDAGVREGAEVDDNEPAWVREHALEERRKRLLRDREDLEEQLRRVREKEEREKKEYMRGDGGGGKRTKKQRVDVAIEKGDEDEDENKFMLDDYESDKEGDNSRRPQPSTAFGIEGLSSATKDILRKLGHQFEGEKAVVDLDLPDELKIFYCSRTHSQLTQFVNELRRVHFPPTVPLGDDQIEEEVKHLSLGSRKNLCINPKVQKLGGVTAINERCLELQQSGTSQEHKCQFLPGKDGQVAVRDFRDHTLARIRDIEELAELGKKIGVCPYYAARPTIKPSEIVTLPYPLLLQKSAREALGISLKGHIVIIDEAHNLIDAISNIHSITVTLAQLQKSQKQLEIYLAKFRNKLKGKNKVYVMQLLKLLSSLAGYLEGKKGEGVIAMGDLLATKGIDQVNIFKLQQYISESKLARKVEGYIDHEERKKAKLAVAGGTEMAAKTTPTLTHIQGFLSALTNPSAEGKVFHGTTDDRQPCVKYMLLDPAHYFRSVVDDARAVILAGGTMEPVNDFRTHLFPYVSPARITTLSCGHVIPRENLLAWSAATGPSGRELKFTFDKRNNNAMIDDLGRAIVNLCLVIPHGVVCFFPSYAYLELVVSRWQQTDTASTTTTTIWERLGQRKTLFTESKSSSSVEDILHEYGHAIDAGKGGLLFSVVGGKMSEGINFNDSLGRGVIMVGLPFPNSQSAEWRAKLEHVEKVASQNYSPADKSLDSPAARNEFAKAAGREFYENACMRAVNQSIGRAIRHQQDYAVIVLMDQRYSLPRITSKLPKWIRDSVVDGEKKPFTDLMRSAGMFFRSRDK
ncbi:helicase C-terminal domain-containing protein [Peziza echinospora]|nr:helicase C-terminal domain-containing protein [Peziza echinospora]